MTKNTNTKTMQLAIQFTMLIVMVLGLVQEAPIQDTVNLVWKNAWRPRGVHEPL